jgi:hypothetical protein
MHYLILRIITLIHVLFVVLEICTPFMNSNYLLAMHIILSPFIMAHWIMNDSTCFVTLVEKKLRYHLYGLENLEADCVTCRIIDPIYKYKKDNEDRGNMPYYVMSGFWFASIIHLYMRRRQGKINTWIDLFVI